MLKKVLSYIGIALVVVLLISGGTILFQYESYSKGSIDVEIPMVIEENSTLYSYYQQVIEERQIENYIKGMDLTCVEVQMRFSDGEYSIESVDLYFYRYINNLREGGNVSEAKICIEGNTIVRIETFKGASKAATWSGVPLRDVQIKMEYDLESLMQLVESNLTTVQKELFRKGYYIMSIRIWGGGDEDFMRCEMRKSMERPIEIILAYHFVDNTWQFAGTRA